MSLLANSIFLKPIFCFSHIIILIYASDVIAIILCFEFYMLDLDSFLFALLLIKHVQLRYVYWYIHFCFLILIKITFKYKSILAGKCTFNWQPYYRTFWNHSTIMYIVTLTVTSYTSTPLTHTDRIFCNRYSLDNIHYMLI